MLTYKVDIYKIQGGLLSLLFNANRLYLFHMPPGIVNALITAVLFFTFFVSNWRQIFFGINSRISLLAASLIVFLTYSFITLFFAPSMFAFGLYFKYLIIVGIVYIASQQPVRSMKMFISATIVLNVLLGIITLFNLDFIKGNTTVNYLTISYALGTTFVICFIKAIDAGKLKMFFIALTIMIFAAMLRYPSRGTLLFSTFSSLLYLLYISRRSIKYKIIVFFVLLAASGALIYVWRHYLIDSYLAYRFQHLFLEVEDEPRFILYKNALALLKEHWFFGVGLGNSGLKLGLDPRTYPHNIFLESWLEMGLIGFFSFGLIVLLALRFSIRSMKTGHLGIIFFFAFLFGLLNFQKSFAIRYSHYFFIFAGLSAALLKINRTDVRISNHTD